MIKSYADAARHLGNRNIKGTGKPKTYATQLDNLHNAPISIVYGDVPIVTYYANGSIKLFTGGRFGPTTKSRINEYTPFYIQQVKGVWFITIGRPDASDITMPFKDNMVITINGSIENGMTLEELAKQNEFRAEIKAYANEWAAKFVDGELVGTQQYVYDNNPDLCRQHIKEKKYTAGLAVDAFYPTHINHYYLVAAESFLRGSKAEKQSRDMYIREFSKMAYKFLCNKLGVSA